MKCLFKNVNDVVKESFLTIDFLFLGFYLRESQLWREVRSICTALSVSTPPASRHRTTSID